MLILSLSICANELKKVSLQLQWKYQFQFAGYIMAKEKGLYRNIGLDVNIKEWSHNIEMVDEVINNKSQYAISRPTSMIDISKGSDIIYIATIFQSSPLILLADKSSGITTVKDFVGKRMMSTGDMNTDTSFISMMMSQGVDINDITIQQPSFNPIDLINGKTDLMASYISNEPFVLKELGGNPIVFSPKDYGFDFYNDILITNKTYLDNNSNEVKDFRKATIDGWEYAFSNIEETVDIIFNKYNTQNKSKEALYYEAKELKKLAYYKTDEIGKIESNKLEKIYDVYKLLGLVQNDINFNQIIYNEQTLDLNLNKKEREYLKNKKSISMCIDPNWMPFEQFDQDGKYVGMSADYYKIFEKFLNVKFQPLKVDTWSDSIEYAKKRECDIFSLAMETPERSKYMNFTTPYLSIPLVVATKLNIPFIDHIEELAGKKIGITKGYAFVEILRNKHPYLDIREVENIDDGLDQVNNGDLYAFIGTLASVGYKFQTKYSGELKIAGKISDHWELGIGVRNDDLVLLTILQKAINNLSNDQRRKILNKWVSIKYEKGVDYDLLYKTLFISLIILMVILFFYFKQRNLKIKLELAYTELEKLAITDKLTGLYNRHKLDKVLEHLEKESKRYNTTFGIIILDIDHFKDVNDNYGHNIGDEVLKEFAQILKHNSRETDCIGRWGGEEFLIIVPHANKASISHYANNLREKIEKYKFRNFSKITASFGVTVHHSNESEKDTIKRADTALYISKNNGRNMVNYV